MLLASVLLALFVAGQQAPAAPPPAAPVSNIPSTELLARLPEEWREPTRAFARIPDNQWKQLLGAPEETLRQTLALLGAGKRR